MRVSILLALTQIACVAVAQGIDSFCAVELSVLVPNGNPVRSGTAQLLDATGKIIKNTEVTDGNASFCDFGFGPHSVRVEASGTLPVTLAGLHLVPKQTQRLRVVMNPAPAAPQGGGGTACPAYIRLESDHQPVSGGKAIAEGTTYEADAFGRLFLLVPLSRFTPFRFEAPGYQSREVSFSCSTWYEEIERSVILNRVPR